MGTIVSFLKNRSKRGSEAADERSLSQVAASHDLREVVCPSCRGTSREDGPCNNCGGSGRLWRSRTGATISDAGVRKLSLPL